MVPHVHVLLKPLLPMSFLRSRDRRHRVAEPTFDDVQPGHEELLSLQVSKTLVRGYVVHVCIYMAMIFFRGL